MKNVTEVQLSRVVYMCWRLWAILWKQSIQELQLVLLQKCFLRLAVVHAGSSGYGLKGLCMFRGKILHIYFSARVYLAQDDNRMTPASTYSHFSIQSPTN